MAKRKFSIENVARYVLVLLLIYIFMITIFISIINPESYFFGKKLGGAPAAAYLLTNGILGILTAFLLLKKKNIGAIISILYFSYNFTEVLITNVVSLRAYVVSPLFTAGLIVSITLFFCHKQVAHQDVVL